MNPLFGWSPELEHRPCPLASTYQLARNVLAACVDDGGEIQPDRGHALIIYDRRNPSFAPDGDGDLQWRAAKSSLRATDALRRLSWQAFVAQWPRHAALDWLKAELAAKYGI
jgi:hypothetical protein